MSRATQIQNKLNVKVFNDLGSDGALYNLTSSTVDKWGDMTKTYASSTAVKMVPYNVIDDNQNYRPFGDLGEAEMEMVVPYGTTVNVHDKITIRSVDYDVVQKGGYPLLNEELAWVLRIAKIH